MKRRPNEPPMPEPLAYFLTWATYGTWLPGDKRGWIEYHNGWQLPDPIRELEALAKMTEGACRLIPEQRTMVENQIAETCKIRGWQLHAVNCRSNHVHVVLSANLAPRVIRSQLKAWCIRALKENTRRQSLDSGKPATSGVRENWWAERGSQRFINDEESWEAAILYVRDGQDKQRH